LDSYFKDTSSAALYIGIFALNPRFNNIIGASHPGGHLDRIRGAINGAGTALHAAIAITDSGLLVLQFKHAVRAYEFTHTATHTGLAVKFQRRYAGEISEIFHFYHRNLALVFTRK